MLCAKDRSERSAQLVSRRICSLISANSSEVIRAHAENGTFYITSRTLLLETGCRLSGKTAAVVMPEASFLEIDESDDWFVVERLLERQQQARLQERLAKIRCVLTDCDGVLTDGGMYYFETGGELIKFNTRDDKGFQLFREHGNLTGTVTGEAVEPMRRRAAKIQVVELHTGAHERMCVVAEICEQRKLSFEAILFIGDDINDLEAIRAVGVGCTVSDATERLKEAADYVTEAEGDRGAFREVAEMVLGENIFLQHTLANKQYA